MQEQVVKFYKTGGTGANPSWTTMSSDVVRVSNVTSGISSVSEISVQDVFSSTYNYYKVIVTGWYQSAQVEPRMRLLSSGSSQLSANAYIVSGLNDGRDTSGTNYQSHENSQRDYLRLQDNFANNSSYPSHVEFEFFNPTTSNKYHLFRFYHICWSGTSWAERQDSIVAYNASTSFTGFRLYPASGTMTVDSLKIYAFK